MEINSHNVSIALCTFNGSKFIDDQLESIKEQTFLPDELIIVDDCSTDDTLERVARFGANSSFPVNIKRNSHRLGPAKNFEYAISECSGELIALCDQDDIWEINKLEISINSLLSSIENDISFPALLHTGSEFLFDNGVVEKNPCRYRGEAVPEMSGLLARFMMQNTVTGCTMLITKGLKHKALPFPDNIIMHDWWLALNAAAYGSVYYLDKSTVLYRRHGNTVTSSNSHDSIFSKLRYEYRGLFSLLKCLYGHQMYEAELEQGMAFLSKNDIEKSRTGMIMESIEKIEKRGISEALRFINDNDIFWADKYEKCKAAMSLRRFIKRNKHAVMKESI